MEPRLRLDVRSGGAEGHVTAGEGDESLHSAFPPAMLSQPFRNGFQANALGSVKAVVDIRAARVHLDADKLL